MIGYFTPRLFDRETFAFSLVATGVGNAIPAAAQAGDLCVVFRRRRDTSTPGLPSGYTNLANASGGLSGTLGLSCRLFFKVLLSGDLGSTLPSVSETVTVISVFRSNFTYTAAAGGGGAVYNSNSSSNVDVSLTPFTPLSLVFGAGGLSGESTIPNFVFGSGHTGVFDFSELPTGRVRYAFASIRGQSLRYVFRAPSTSTLLIDSTVTALGQILLTPTQ